MIYVIKQGEGGGLGVAGPGKCSKMPTLLQSPELFTEDKAKIGAHSFTITELPHFLICLSNYLQFFTVLG